jgi:hypothetical protein
VAHAKPDRIVGDVVSDQIEHSILQGRIALCGSGKEGAYAEGLALHAADGRHGARLALRGVDVLALEDAIESEDEDAAAVVSEAACAGVGLRAVEKVLGADFTAVDKADDEAVNLVAELLDEV